MTDTAAVSSATPPSDTRATVQRRLVGLCVLLLGFFLLSLLVRSRPGASEALQAVVIPLNPGTAANPLNAVEEPALPELDQEPEAATSSVIPTEVPPPKPESTKAAAAPASPRPAAGAPAQKPKPGTVTEKPKPVVASKPDKPVKPATTTDTGKAESQRKWFVVVGAYKDPMASKAIASRAESAGMRVEIVPITQAGERLNRVVTGPYASKQAAEAARVALIVEGLTKATVTGEK